MPTWDFNGDGVEDVLWRHTDGRVTTWLGGTGGLVANDAVTRSGIPASWQVLTSGDFNGDGNSDILWRNWDIGRVSNWLGTDAGGFLVNDAAAMRQVAPQWGVAFAADVNGDGRDDLIWANWETRQLSTWLGTENGGFTVNDSAAMRSFGSGWFILGTGDFNGDGNSDLLWRAEQTTATAVWYGNDSGGFTVPAPFTVLQAPDFATSFIADFNGDGFDDVVWRGADNLGNGDVGILYGGDRNSLVRNSAATDIATTATWTILGTGDFNGDGRADLLWRNDDGRVSNWLGSASGTFVINDANAMTAPISYDWAFTNIADYNGDNRDDIFWREYDGSVATWLANEAGGWGMGAARQVGSGWQVASSMRWHDPYFYYYW